MSIRFVLAAAMVIGLPTLLQAQYGGRTPYGRQPVNVQPVEIKGTIQGIVRNGIVVVDGNNQTWRIAILLSATPVLPATKVQVTGAVTADSLRSGLIVEFVAETDGRSAIQDKVGELTVTSLGPQKQMGLFPPSDLGAGDQPGGFGGDANGGAADKRAARARGKAAAGAGKYRIVGRLIVGRGGALSVQPGHGALPFALNDDPSIKVNMTDFSAVKQGYEVSVKGMMVPNRPGTALAREVKVTLPEPPGGAKKKPAAKPDDKQPPETPKKDKDAGLPAPAPEK